jgi:hypothetical protein
VSTYERAGELVDKLTAAGVGATLDPRSATPPCVLVTPPTLTYDAYGSALADWSLYVLSPATGNADAWLALDELGGLVADVLPIARREFVAYSLSPDAPPVPSYRLTFSEGINL